MTTPNLLLYVNDGEVIHADRDTEAPAPGQQVDLLTPEGVSRWDVISCDEEHIDTIGGDLIRITLRAA